MTIRTRILLPLSLLLALAGCERPETAWQEARETDTIAAYEDFLERHPEAPQAAEAERRIGEIRRAERWQQAQADDTVPAYEQFLTDFSEGEEAEQARARLAEIERQQEWAALRDSDDIEALRDFSARHRDYEVAEQAGRRADELEAEREAAERARLEEERRLAEEEARRTHRVQLAAFRTEQRARDGAATLQEQLADVLGELALEVAQPRELFLVVTEPLPDEDARALCAQLRAQGTDCVVVAR